MSILRSICTSGLGLFLLLFISLHMLFDRNQAADDVLNAARSSSDYVHAFSNGLKPYDKAQFRRAKAYYQTLIDGKFNTSLMYNNLAYVQFYSRQFDQALQSLNEALNRDRSNYSIYMNMALVLLEKKDFKSAELLMSQAQDLLPVNVDDFIRILHILPRHQSNPVFEYYYTHRVSWDRIMLLNYLCQLNARLNNDEKLLAIASFGVKKFPMDPEFYYYMAVAAYHTGRFDLALEYLIKVITLAPNYLPAYELRARINSDRGNKDLVQLDLDQVNQLKLGGRWVREKSLTDLHHWDNDFVLFQIYK